MASLTITNSSTLPPSSACPPAEWRARVVQAQKSRLDPEVQARVEARAAARTRAKKSAGRAKRLQTVQAYSKSAWGGSMASLRRASEPTRADECMNSMSSTFGAAFQLQTVEEASTRVEATSEALATLQRAADCSDDEEAEEAVETARLQLESSGHAWAARGAEGATEAALMLEEGGRCPNHQLAIATAADTGGNGILDSLLEDLRIEPTDDADAARRFRLYEAHAETVSKVRKSLFEFWEASQPQPEGAPKNAIEASLRAVDGHENLEVYFNERFWFVYSMAQKVSRNERLLGEVLKEIETKLEILAREGEDCPICLEPICAEDDEAAKQEPGLRGVALGCAHKIHAGCWSRWSQVCAQQRKNPFCPLCKNEEFLEDIMSNQ
jgi:hypothetical protein